MEFDKIVKLIHAVGESGLSEFSFEEGALKISMRGGEKQGKTVEFLPKAVEIKEEIKEKPTAIRGKTVKSPLVGTFYAAPSPEAETFVKKGDTVKKGQVLGIVEAMKLMNEIESEYDGVVEDILIGNEDTVEYGQPLFVIA
ncbi:MAG: acetyl-CoA carboxylase biotin carboxyl carrier protein [Blautia hansenii]|nr:acetyl-CoA carboxylase biotin carboxyl carrier protein [Blautia hansenii]MEE0656359.1 acetyl-CoA carboxylase biotin carboxyl carrier protein [Blautia hansenii]